jgi:hypothetical protein
MAILFSEGDKILQLLDNVEISRCFLFIFILFILFSVHQNSFVFQITDEYSSLPYPFSFIASVVERYQAQPNILDSHIEKISRKIIEHCRKQMIDLFKNRNDNDFGKTSEVVTQISYYLKILYILCKCRGAKIVSLLIREI